MDVASALARFCWYWEIAVFIAATTEGKVLESSASNFSFSSRSLSFLVWNVVLLGGWHDGPFVGPVDRPSTWKDEVITSWSHPH